MKRNCISYATAFLVLLTMVLTSYSLYANSFPKQEEERPRSALKQETKITCSITEQMAAYEKPSNTIINATRINMVCKPDERVDIYSKVYNLEIMRIGRINADILIKGQSFFCDEKDDRCERFGFDLIADIAGDFKNGIRFKVPPSRKPYLLYSISGAEFAELSPIRIAFMVKVSNIPVSSIEEHPQGMLSLEIRVV